MSGVSARTLLTMSARTWMFIALLPALACATLLAARPNAGRSRPVDGPTVLREAIAAMRSEALGRERVELDSLEKTLLAKLGKDAPPPDAWPLIREAIAALNDPHAQFIPVPPSTPEATTPSATTRSMATDSAPAPAAPAPATSSPPVQSQPATPEIPTKPIGRLLDGGVAYVLMPGCAFGPEVDLQRYARTARQLIAGLSVKSPRGWIIDLRLNGGGTVWPMLLGLQPLLGDGPQMTSVNNSYVTATFGLDRNDAWLESKGNRIVSLHMSEDDVATATDTAPPRIAVLLGPWTMSSGESLAIALRSLKGARTFGEPTAGLTTVTQMYTLSDGSTLILPVALMGDKDGQAVNGAIKPDEPVTFNNWPDAEDAVAKAAHRWIDGTD